MSPTNFPEEHTPSPVISVVNSSELPETDVQIVTSGGMRIPVHRNILVSASPVLESIMDKSSGITIPILGVPCQAVVVFVRFLYIVKCTSEELNKYGIHLLALSHVFLVPQLKQRCSKALADWLTIDSVVDVLQLARLCDAPDLYLKCMKLVSNNFESVEITEGWKFVQENDPWLELQILQFIDETELRRKKTRRQREEQSLYLQLSEAMECLEHICTQGCTSVGPHDMEPITKRDPCTKFATCQGLQHSIRHFATCRLRVNGRCLRCKRMWQLFRLHSSICDQPDLCKVPLCRNFTLKAQEEKRGDAARWKLLVRKVVSAKTISSLSKPQRKRERERANHSWN